MDQRKGGDTTSGVFCTKRTTAYGYTTRFGWLYPDCEDQAFTALHLLFIARDLDTDEDD